MAALGIGFSGAVRRGFATYGTFSGRASRGEYWWWTLFTAGSLLVLAIPAAVLGTLTSPDGGEAPAPPARYDPAPPRTATRPAERTRPSRPYRKSRERCPAGSTPAARG